MQRKAQKKFFNNTVTHFFLFLFLILSLFLLLFLLLVLSPLLPHLP
jgi:hypothetical protein